jgi:RNA polymerase sigma factor (sigma-70 family)
VSVLPAITDLWESTLATTATERLAELFDAHHERLFRLALRMACDREEARDLVQEAFLRAAARPASVPEGASGGEAWLVRTLVNLCRDRWRRRAVRERARPELAAREEAVDAEGALVARAAVRGALARLSPRRRAVIVLCELDGRTVREVARLLGVAEVTVRWHLLAARRDLAKILGEEERR